MEEKIIGCHAVWEARMKQIRKIVETISNTSSLNEKVKLLQAQKDNEVLFTLLKLHADPYIQFYVSKLPKTRPNAIPTELKGSNNYEKFLHLTQMLQHRIITGHAALATIFDFFQKCDEDETWVFKTVLLKNPLNFGRSLINKVRKGFIPEFKLMLADHKQPTLNSLKFPLIAQTKLDGHRAVYFPELQQFIGRNGNPISNEKLNTWFTKMIEQNTTYILDGELYSDTLSFNDISSRLNSEDGDLTSIYYCLYDILTTQEWTAQVGTQKYKDRIALIHKLVNTWNTPNVKAVEGKVINTVNELETYYKEKLAEGYEGLMLKDMDGLYQWKRVSCKSGIMMKLKPSDEYDGKIVKCEEGTGQCTGTLGAFIVKVEGIKNLVRVGSGYTQEARKEYWENKDKMIGQWIKVKAWEITEGNESLRFPVFLSLRDPKD
jgi:DNA ligase-1